MIKLVIIGITTPATVKFRPAVHTIGFCVDVVFGKSRLDFTVKTAVLNAPHFVFWHAHKLVARVNIPLGSNRNVLVTATATLKPFD
jgi:hypothetical protein